jgi:hypothetical protein
MSGLISIHKIIGWLSHPALALSLSIEKRMRIPSDFLVTNYHSPAPCQLNNPFACSFSLPCLSGKIAEAWCLVEKQVILRLGGID